MRFSQGGKNAPILSMVALLASALVVGCKSEEAKQQEQVAEKVQATVQQAQTMTDADLLKKVNDIHQRKGMDPANMTPEERTLIGQALVKGLL